MEVAPAAVALGVRAVGRVAEDRHAEAGRGAAVVGVGVAEHDAVDAAEAARPPRRSPASSSAMPASNSVTPPPSSSIRYTFIVARHAAAQQPHAVGDALRSLLRRQPPRRAASWR